MTGLIIKKLHALEELLHVQQLEEEIWNMPPIPVHQTLVVAKNGGLILGAFHNDKLVGYNYSFIGGEPGNYYLYSHMTGVHSEYRRQGIGFQLKKQQQSEARLMGFSKIIWTYDPLETVNGFLNLTKLKGVATNYLENYYGHLNDGLNTGLPTDRFQITWWLDHADVSELPEHHNHEILKIGQISYEKNTADPILKIAAKKEDLKTIEMVRVPVPSNFQDLKKRNLILANDWRMKTRRIFKNLFESGFLGMHLTKGEDRNTTDYVFVKADQL